LRHDSLIPITRIVTQLISPPPSVSPALLFRLKSEPDTVSEQENRRFNSESGMCTIFVFSSSVD